MCHGHSDYFQKPPFGGRPNAKPGDYGTPNANNRWFILFYDVEGPAWIKIHWNSIWVEGMFIYGFTLHLRVHDHTTWFWRCRGTAFGHFLLGSHNFMVTTLGSCVKWLLGLWLGYHLPFLIRSSKQFFQAVVQHSCKLVQQNTWVH
jgi:hypothetical protein